jgi:hypothetical protein
MARTVDDWRGVHLLSGEKVRREQRANSYPLGTPVPAIAGWIALTDRRVLFSPRKMERLIRRAHEVAIPYGAVDSVSEVRRVIGVRKVVQIEAKRRKYHFLVNRRSRFLRDLLLARDQERGKAEGRYVPPENVEP